VLAVVGYRIVNYWLPLLPGAVAYLRLRLSPARPNTHKLELQLCYSRLHAACRVGQAPG